MSDPLAPPTARQPEETLELVSLALSDGDLEAALAQYEHGALVWPWARPAPPQLGSAGDVLLGLMRLRIPVCVSVRAVLPAGELALVLGEWRMASGGPDHRRIRLSGAGSTVVRRQRDGAWRIVADAWCLDGPGAADVGRSLPGASPRTPSESPEPGAPA